TVDWSVDRSSVRSSVRSEGDESTDGQIITILSTNPRCTLEEIAKVLGFTKRGVEKAVRRLRLAQRLRKVGGKRFGHWEVAE
ncbi:MAG: winged helix-turn-helix transcriptional regulator, partial [Kiritimatiellae bacterium]|nr:winged helix-turn-helix transcriptional regulator [Kiritimatiellia bacterium]